MTSSHAALFSRSTADWASIGSAIIASHSVGASAPFDPGPPLGGTDDGSDGRSTDHRTRRPKTNRMLEAVGEARTEARASGQRNPAMGAFGRDY
jgi:hypothetical protein